MLFHIHWCKHKRNCHRATDEYPCKMKGPWSCYITKTNLQNNAQEFSHTIAAFTVRPRDGIEVPDCNNLTKGRLWKRSWGDYADYKDKSMKLLNLLKAQKNQTFPKVSGTKLREKKQDNFQICSNTANSSQLHFDYKTLKSLQIVRSTATQKSKQQLLLITPHKHK